MMPTDPKNPPDTFALSKPAAIRLNEVAETLKVSPDQVLSRALHNAKAEDLKEPAPDDRAVQEVDVAPRTATWARLNRPFAWAIVAILAIVLAAPFLFISGVAGLQPEARVEKLLTWATHVLAPVVGIASAVVTYFFGRGTGDGSSR